MLISAVIVPGQLPLNNVRVRPSSPPVNTVRRSLALGGSVVARLSQRDAFQATLKSHGGNSQKSLVRENLRYRIKSSVPLGGLGSSSSDIRRDEATF
jgi:hypothetical protein